jgi:hypothetical protein
LWKRNISMGTWEHRKLGSSLSIHPLGSSVGGDPSKHRENIKGVICGFED